MDRTSIVAQALAAPPEAIRRVLAESIRAASPELHVALTHDIYGEVYRFAAKGHCSLRSAPGFDADVLLNSSQGIVHGSPQTAWWEIEWDGMHLELVEVQLSAGFHREPFIPLIGPNGETVRAFLIALERFTSNVDEAVLVFQDGCWSHDETLYQDIQASTFQNLVLPPGMADQVRDDVEQWLESRDLYERHGVPWKRGMIFVGPPGNGKTHMIKALINQFGINALYVRGFGSEYDSDAHNISSVFRRARECAPAMLILEDLDTLVNSENRSHFLNELDGFALNTGILAVASANDAARLDPALVNRPSRFDRRYAFDLPDAANRSRYLQFFTSSLDADLRLGDADAAKIGVETEGFSFAYLKELVLSSMMSWISSGRGQSFSDVIICHVAPLKAQMAIDPEPTPAAGSSEDPAAKRAAAVRRRMRR